MSFRIRAAVLWVSLATLNLMALAGEARCCPLCGAAAPTFGEEFANVDVVVVARLVEPPPPVKSASTVGDELARAKFDIDAVIKGKSLVEGTKRVETIYFGDAKLGQSFLIMGVDPPKLQWSTPLVLSDRGRKYMNSLLTLPKEGPERLKFFLDYLEDRDEQLARDSHDEFAKAPYEHIRGVKSLMNHDKLLAWISDADVPSNRRRLYFMMLSVCGTEKDLAFLESLMKSNDRKQKAGLDAMVACYVSLKGADGLPLVEDLFLKNDKSDYADTYAAIMALRVHGTDLDVVPKKRLLESLAYMLDRPQLADLVIPDLARWEDWTRVDKLVKLFKESDEKTSWVRVPVINYLRACPLPEAKERIKELEKIDPVAVKRANTFFPFGASGAGAPAPPPKSS